ncbi:phosphatidylglycerophosphatase A [Thiohalobacter sp. IOR34]|uniref:phosphatidylglycerophosphatase A family protein n=1 Tax=Thiohalobacter sp. IOR34 TaxID=3057176 RepID=UPI0025AF7D8A|nr:phosphatidylglycerophosphatase A [Thiohalobacter sp. IOR34]WJW76224.1 phosphatidylglycerophosphatase A [Thiohalobacter sp. IOR34]
MKRHPPVPPRLLRDPGHLLALGFGSGLAPVAPGTFGTLAAIPLWWLGSQLSLSLYLGLLLLLSLLGIWLCGRTARALGVHDHPAIVWDEFAGFLLTMAWAPAGWIWLLLGFGLFRLFDIWKPWPIRFLDRRLGGGLGIMLDDLLAGAFAAVVIYGLGYGGLV